MKRDIDIALKLIIVLFFMILSSVASSFIAFKANAGEFFDFNEYILNFAKPMSLMLFIFMLGLFLIFFIIFNKRNGYKITEKDERGFNASKTGLYGTSDFMNQEEMEDTFEVDEDIEEIKGTIVGVTEYDEIVAYKDTDNNSLNQNIMVIGESGRGKSRACVGPTIIQASLREESILVADPKGEFYEGFSEYLRDKDYFVKVINLIDLNCSDVWDILMTIKKDKDSMIANCQTFCSVIIKNTGDEKDPFANAEESLLNALVLYVVLGEGYREEEKTFASVVNLLVENDIDSLTMLFDAVSKDHPCRFAWSSFISGSANKAGNVLSGLGVRLAPFADPNLGKVLGYDKESLDLKKPLKDKCAYFFVIDIEDKRLKFVPSLFFTMFFIEVSRFVKLEAQGKKWRIVNLIADEFCNIGVIPNYSSIITTVRSNKVSVMMIIQDIPQLASRYGENDALTILNNCNCTIFLGTENKETANYISDRSGIMTVDVKSMSRSKKTFDPVDYQSEFKESQGEGKRPVLLPDEVYRKNEIFGHRFWKDYDEKLNFIDAPIVFVLHRDKKILVLRRFDYSLHPESKKFKKVNMRDYIPEWKKKTTLI